MFITNSGHGHVKLSMSKALFWLQEQSSISQCLSLTHVECHAVAEADWELKPLELVDTVQWRHWNFWNHDVLTLTLASKVCGNYDIIKEHLHLKASAVHPAED